MGKPGKLDAYEGASALAEHCTTHSQRHVTPFVWQFWSMTAPDPGRLFFQQLKASCVPLLANAVVTRTNAASVSKYLQSLHATLQTVPTSVALSPSQISYVFYPISEVLRRNSFETVPESVLEGVFLVLAILTDHWWWTCEDAIWEQLLMLCGSILLTPEPHSTPHAKGSIPERSDETKHAATLCLLALLRKRDNPSDLERWDRSPEEANQRFQDCQKRAQLPKSIPIIGRMLDSSLPGCSSKDPVFQKSSLRLVHLLVRFYLRPEYYPAVLPGVSSIMVNVALGRGSQKNWVNGDIVTPALEILQEIIVNAIGDDVCIREGAVKHAVKLEDLAELTPRDVDSQGIEHAIVTEASSAQRATLRTPSWHRGTSTQVHIALNALTPLVKHPNLNVLLALSSLAASLIEKTFVTLPDSQPLLLSFLLTLAVDPSLSVSSGARHHLNVLLKPPVAARFSLTQTLLHNTRDNLSLMPRLIIRRSDSHIEHVAHQIEALCLLAQGVDGLEAVKAGVGLLLGPSGGIEKWGWNLLNALHFRTLPIIAVPVNNMLQYEGVQTPVLFPPFQLDHTSSSTTLNSLASMLRGLGSAGGTNCLYSVEWLIRLARNGRGTREVSAIWCAARIFEGIANASLDVDDREAGFKQERQVQAVAKWIAKTIAEMWDLPDDEPADPDVPSQTEGEDSIIVEHSKGVESLITKLDSASWSDKQRTSSMLDQEQPVLWRALCLHLLTLSSCVLGARFTGLFLQTLYPLLNSLVSPSPFLRSTGHAAIDRIAHNSSYASIANLLLANFDYALDVASRRLTRRNLDLSATEILCLLVRLVGKDIVHRASDVVEECFDRLDDFHGYDAVVEGLIQVLAEVINAIHTDSDEIPEERKASRQAKKLSTSERRSAFTAWLGEKHMPPDEVEQPSESHPRTDWGTLNEDAENEQHPTNASADDGPPKLTPLQSLISQITTRSLPFLTHQSAFIRAQILNLLGTAGEYLPDVSLLSSVHKAWPFVLNRLSDPEPFVVAAAAYYIESLSRVAGDFIVRRLWEDVWPRFQNLLKKLDKADAESALTRRGPQGGLLGTQSAYTTSHRLYVAILKTMTMSSREATIPDTNAWEVIVAFRRFLNKHNHEKLQVQARQLYNVLWQNNEDAVWLALCSTIGRDVSAGRAVSNEEFESLRFLRETWDIQENVELILAGGDHYIDRSTAE
ncbi:hypothetical protein SISSUDRAFT_1029046 [Sistotremastrum suecicum HHB10207 ss-3]|uniref:Uncharacterized protein n=1 Tax=Sistotremastrum suecicum HHB10207 ss-3 TaxID=1314776 RepID=A0A166J344_9AGAM|nr:hypothetical protein SISSUDRAFT_1029046 [Sistotremastrum suecicum HHB10207 ss-3]